MAIDYLSAWTGVGLLLCTPLLRTLWWIDIFLLPAFTYAVIAAFSPIYFSYPTIPLQVVVQGQQHLFIALCLLLVIVLKAKIKTLEIKKWLGNFGIINIILTTFFHFTFDGPYELYPHYIGSPFIINSSMNASVNVLLTPFALQRLGVFFIPYMFLLFYLTFAAHSSSAILTLGIILSSMVLKISNKKSTLAFIFLVVIVAASVLIQADNSVLNDGKRFLAYKVFFEGFTLKDWLIGRGPASFQEWSALIQYKAQARIGGEYFLFMHSDFLQLIWEYGILFLPSAIITVFNYLLNSRNASFYSGLGMLALSIFYYPFHTPIPLFIIFLLLKIVINETGKEWEGQ